MTDKARWTAVVLLSVVLIFLTGSIIVFLCDTIVNPWLFFGIIAVPALGSGLVLAPRWRRLTGIGNYALNFVVNGLVIGIVLSALFLGINYFTADFDGGEPLRGIVGHKYEKTRYRTKRVSRRTYTRGEPYKVFFLQIDLTETGPRDFEVRRELYNSVRNGDTVTYREARGALGMEVIRRSSITPLHLRNKCRRAKHNRPKIKKNKGKIYC